MSIFIKIVLMGGGGIGKIEFRNRFATKGFREEHLMTIGADFVPREITIDENQVLFQIWDLAGQDTFKTVRARFFRGAFGGLALYHINKKASFMNITKWIEELWTNCNRGIVPLNIVGLGAEERDENSVPIEMGKKYAKAITDKIHENNLSYTVKHYEVSVKTGLNIEDPFIDLGRQIIAGLESGSIKLG